jgi:hypothetical protein
VIQDRLTQRADRVFDLQNTGGRQHLVGEGIGHGEFRSVIKGCPSCTFPVRSLQWQGIGNGLLKMAIADH